MTACNPPCNYLATPNLRTPGIGVLPHKRTLSAGDIYFVAGEELALGLIFLPCQQLLARKRMLVLLLKEMPVP